MGVLDDKKSFKDWLSESYEQKEPLTKENSNAEEKKLVAKTDVKTDVKTEESTKLVAASAEINIESPDTKDKTNFDEFKPSWRKKTIPEMDKKAKKKNASKNLQFYFLAALLLIGISIGSFLLWEKLIANRVNTIDSDPSDLIDIIGNGNSSGGQVDPSKTEKNITFYVLEIGVSGSREVAVDEIETSCGDVLVPVQVSKTFNSKDPSELSVLETALTEIIENVDVVYDEERNLVNDVANSGLDLVKVSKVVDRYEVDLTGDLVTTGVCNTERIKFQLEETAKINLGTAEVVFKLDGSTEDYDKMGD